MISPRQQNPLGNIQNLNHGQQEPTFLDDSCFQMLKSPTSFWDEYAVDGDYDSNAAVQCLDLMEILCNESSITVLEDLTEEEDEDDEEIMFLCDAAIHTADLKSPASHQFFVPRPRSPQNATRPVPTEEHDFLIEEPPLMVRRMVTFWDEDNKENISPDQSLSPVALTPPSPPTLRRLPIVWGDRPPSSPASVAVNTHGDGAFEDAMPMLRQSARVNMQAQERRTAALASALSSLRLPHTDDGNMLEASKMEIPVAETASEQEDLVQRWMRRASIAEGFQQKRPDIFVDDEDLATICKAKAITLLQKKRVSYKSTLTGPAIVNENMVRSLPRRQTIHIAMAA